MLQWVARQATTSGTWAHSRLVDQGGSYANLKELSPVELIEYHTETEWLPTWLTLSPDGALNELVLRVIQSFGFL